MVIMYEFKIYKYMQNYKVKSMLTQIIIIYSITCVMNI